MPNNIRAIWRKWINPVDLNDVFTPNTAATFTYVRRDSVESNFDKNYRIHGKQIILYGMSGSGKTTFLERYCEENHISRVSIHCDANMSFNQLMLNAFDKLNLYYQNSQSTSKTQSLNVTNSIGLSKFSFEDELNEENTCTTNTNRFLSPQLTPQRLAEELGKAGKILVVEDFHKLGETDRKCIADMIKLFIDQANIFENLKIICIGASGTAKELIKLDNNLKHRVYECEMPLLNDSEIKQIIDKGCEILNINMEEALVEKIIHYSNRLGTIAHQLCYDVCHSEQIYKTAKRTKFLTSSHFIHAVRAYLDQHSDSLNEAYELAVKDPLGWDLLKTFSYQPHSPLTLRSIVNRVNSKEYSYSEKQVTQKLEELSAENIGIIRSLPGGFRYSISDPFWGAFVKMRIAKEESDSIIALKNQSKTNLLLENENDEEAMLLNILLNKYSHNRLSSKNVDFVEDKLLLNLTIDGTSFEDVEVEVSNPFKTISALINSIIQVFDLPKIDNEHNRIRYQLGLMMDGKEEKVLFDLEDEDGRELCLLDYNVSSGDNLILTSMPIAIGA